MLSRQEPRRQQRSSGRWRTERGLRPGQGGEDVGDVGVVRALGVLQQREGLLPQRQGRRVLALGVGSNGMDHTAALDAPCWGQSVTVQGC